MAEATYHVEMMEVHGLIEEIPAHVGTPAESRPKDGFFISSASTSAGSLWSGVYSLINSMPEDENPC